MTPMRIQRSLGLFTVAALLAGCGSTDFAPSPAALGDGPLVPAPASNSPYAVELVSEGQTLPTYEHQGRFYVLGQVGQRYGIRVTNPTQVRVEAIISVDGLDVIDGETANTNKRGYVVMPHATITIGGFRVTTHQVAAFRFSSVDDSYAGLKGKARNVGAIGVAIFSEQAAQQMIVPEPMVGLDGDRDSDFEDESAPRDFGRGAARNEKFDSKSADRRGVRVEKAPIRRPPPQAGPSGTSISGAEAPVNDSFRPQPEECCAEPGTNRPGLGTEYGERRHSAVSFTRFVRGSSEPTAYAELRYNNAAGLAALGITTGPGFDEREVSRRETAEPFPGQRFSQPPQ